MPSIVSLLDPDALAALRAQRRQYRRDARKPVYRDAWDPITQQWVPTDVVVPVMPERDAYAFARSVAVRDTMRRMMETAPYATRTARSWDARTSRGWQYRNGSRSTAPIPSDSMTFRDPDHIRNMAARTGRRVVAP